MSDLFLRPLFTWRSLVASKFGPENPTTRQILIFLSLHMSEKGDSCFPSTRTLAEETGLAHRSIVTHLAEAERTGWIGKRERKTSGQGWRRMEYFAVIPPDAEAAFQAFQRDERGASGQGDAPNAPRQRDERGSKGDERGSKGDAPRSSEYFKSTSKNSTTPCAEPPSASPPFLTIPLVSKQGEFLVTENDVAEWQASFPGIDVKQHLRIIRQWNVDNPTRRKTRNGIRGHISRWLAKEQNSRPTAAAPAVKSVDTSCRREQPGGGFCGMPGSPDPVWGYSCAHCTRKERESRPSARAGMPTAVRDVLKNKGLLKGATA